jgi:hypothetical protein
MSDLWAILLGWSAGLAVLLAGAFAWAVVYHRSVVAVLDNPAGGWLAALILFFGLLALVAAVPLLAEQGLGRSAAVVGINLLVQPLCGLLVVGCGHQFVMGLSGRLTYKFRVIPPDETGFDPALYRRLVRDRALGGLAGILFFGGLSAVCLWPFVG